MSRIANKPIPMADKVDVQIKEQTVKVKGPKGELSFDLHPTVTIEQKDNELVVTANDSNMAMAGTMRSMVANMIEGVSNGFTKKLALKIGRASCREREENRKNG